MGKVDCLSVTWGNCFFYSSDHRPQHFHVECTSEDWEIRVMIETTTEGVLDYNFKFPKSRKEAIASKYQKELRALVVKYRETLMKEWTLKVSKGK